MSIACLDGVDLWGAQLCESPWGAGRLLPDNTPGSVLREPEDGWLFVRTDEGTGWVRTQHARKRPSVVPATPEELAALREAARRERQRELVAGGLLPGDLVDVTGDLAILWAGPDAGRGSKVLGRLTPGTTATVLSPGVERTASCSALAVVQVGFLVGYLSYTGIGSVLMRGGEET